MGEGRLGGRRADSDGRRDSDGQGDGAEGGPRSGLVPAQIPPGQADGDGPAGRRPGDGSDGEGSEQEHPEHGGDGAGDDEARVRR